MSSESKPVKDPAEAATDPAPAAAHESEYEDEDDEQPEAANTAAGSSSTATKKKKKKSKRQKLKDAVGVGSSSSASAQSDATKALGGLTTDQLTDLLKMNPALAHELGTALKTTGKDEAATIDQLKKLSLQEIMTGLAASGKNVKDMASYKFWQTQPVPKFGEDERAVAQLPDGPIESQTVEDVPKDAPKMIEGFEWCTPNLEDPAEITEVYELLNGHYVEDDEAMFRFKYSVSVLKWAMMSPDWRKQWWVGVRATQSRKLVAFISAIPMKLRVRENVLQCAEVNFICVHKRLRSKRMAPVLIREVTRRINLQNIWQAIYTAGVVLPKPVSTCRYFHRALDWQKLYEIGFSPLPANSKPSYQVMKYKLPEKTLVKGLREMKEKDVPAVSKLLHEYMKRYDLAPQYDETEMKHWFLDTSEAGDERVVYSYVVEDDDKKITDFFSFYLLSSSVLNNPKHSVLRAAYIWQYASDVAFQQPFDKAALKKRLNELIKDMLILAKSHRFDVMNGLSSLDNGFFLEEQKFGPGDGQLFYYLFNYRTAPIAGGIDARNDLTGNGSGIGLNML
ncbi:hypothetical protein MCOR25_005986 [Pyricularia grisea]|uniref:Glycylpeptide N-tetradecanoyltransferase n=1 Tax=Pyricularia grisea TaxID=148305 RepID=A0A6P8B037_PYRGI|nr:uncharacterized protein PgNI_07654 [Pyricularia grisea]KAI6363200.1 hypothetical protein MCOR25_005986 [Pyricularia grisea]TLD08194.1 hypothetical protein PgNI_07654 [Pyricularia grisea]